LAVLGWLQRTAPKSRQASISPSVDCTLGCHCFAPGIRTGALDPDVDLSMGLGWESVLIPVFAVAGCAL
jgi:hypothetical protein